jgi:hypothetical protein
VRGDAQQIYAELVYVERELPRRLHCIAVKINVSFGSDSANFFDGLNRTQLVVRVHHADKDGFCAQRAANFIGIDYT